MAFNSDILSLPFRRADKVALSAAIKQYVSAKYGQYPYMFEQDLEIIDNLRRNAINVNVPHDSGLKHIATYAAHLVCIRSKFPIEIGVEFTWYPALGTMRPMTQCNFNFELSNILYNLAALYSQLAASANRGSADELKSACHNFCFAAGLISHLKKTVIPELRSRPEDMDIATLESLQQLLLAQAQECYWHRAVVSGCSDTVIAQLAARVSDLYSSARNWSIKSKVITSEWTHYTNAKHYHFAAAAQYRQACVCLKQSKYGEEVAWLRDSLVCINEALKKARYINKTVVSDLDELKVKLQEELKRAEKDNDLIYLHNVPPKSELKTILRKNMATETVPTRVCEPSTFIGERKEFGRPLFAQLVPFAVHETASVYEERRVCLVTSIISELERLNTKIHDTLVSLNLPGALPALHALVLSDVEDIRQADTLSRLQRSFADTAKLKSSAEAIFSEGREILLRCGAGASPNLITRAKKLRTQVTEFEGYLRDAADCDELVEKDMLELLANSEFITGDPAPNSLRAKIRARLEAEATKLQIHLNDLIDIESRRGNKIEKIREESKKDDFNSAILVEIAKFERAYPRAELQFARVEEFFKQRLAQYNADGEGVKVEALEQDQFLKQLEGANIAFAAAKKDYISSEEQARQKIENACNEIGSNVEASRNFYNDLNNIVKIFREDCYAYSYSWRSEATQIESDLSLVKNNLRLETPPIELLAPTPTRIPQLSKVLQGGLWSPEMGIKFGG